MKKSNIYFGYNERLFMDGILSLLRSSDNYNIIGYAANGNELFNSVKSLKIDILIIELGFPNDCNLKYVKRLRSDFPDIKILLVTSLFKQGLINKFIDLGIESYILKKCTDNDLFNALEKLENNEKYYCSSITQILLKEFHEANETKNDFLTSREIEIMKHLIDGDSNYNISRNLKISLHTVKTHRKNIMDKFGAKNLVSIIRYACRENLIDQDNGSFCKACPYKIAATIN